MKVLSSQYPDVWDQMYKTSITLNWTKIVGITVMIGPKGELANIW